MTDIYSLTDRILESYDEKTMKKLVWDLIYDELIQLSKEDLEMFAEDYDLIGG